MAEQGRCLAVVGAESTGKTQLALALVQRLRESTGLRVACVPEYLRQWCEVQGRTPRAEEQAHILAQQQRHIDAAAAQHDWVVCDTTPLMTAVYSRLVFGDITLEARAGELHRRSMVLTLLTALDLPWVADGLQRDGPHMQGPVDQALRELMQLQGIAYGVVGGAGQLRLEHAWRAVAPLISKRADPSHRRGLFTGLATDRGQSPRWACECCTPNAEQALRQQASASG